MRENYPLKSKAQRFTWFWLDWIRFWTKFLLLLFLFLKVFSHSRFKSYLN